MKQNDKPIANPDVVLREEFDDWAVLFNPDTADAVGVNPVGVAVWKMMDGRHTVGDVAELVGRQFANVPESAVKEIQSFVEQLAEQGFVGLEVEDTSG